MIFLETSFLIGFFVEKDEHHERSLELIKTIKGKETAISEMVIYETLTVLRKKNQSNEQVANIYNKLTKMNVFEDVLYYNQAVDLTLDNGIGFFDNLSYAVMKNNDITDIVSFDEDFDTLNDIKRIS